jgi:hypothetical protein
MKGFYLSECHFIFVSFNYISWFRKYNNSDIRNIFCGEPVIKLELKHISGHKAVARTLQLSRVASQNSA